MCWTSRRLGCNATTAADQDVAGLRDLDNTVLVIEHDLGMIAASDWIVDFGPGAVSAGRSWLTVRRQVADGGVGHRQ